MVRKGTMAPMVMRKTLGSFPSLGNTVQENVGHCVNKQDNY